MIGGFDSNVYQQNAYQNEGGVAPAPLDIAPSVGNIDWRKRGKKPHKVIRFSDFETQEKLAMAIAEAAMPIARIVDSKIIAPDVEYEDDDDAIIKALFLITTIH